jgi:hypothetical protein
MVSDNKRSPKMSRPPNPVSEQVSPQTAAARLLGSRGGAARARNLSKAQIRAIGKKGADIRWGKATGVKGRRQ